MASMIERVAATEAEAARIVREARMQRIREEGAAAAEASCKAARARIPDAAAYILSEVTK